VLTAGGGRPERAAGPRRGSGAPGETDEPAQVLELDDLDDESDAEAMRRSREIASALSIPRPPRDSNMRRGFGELDSVPYRGTADEIDLDATLENLTGKHAPEAADVVVRERIRTRRSVVLLVDVSGSMRGERVRSAAATVGALAGELAREHLAVVAFWSDAAVLAPLGDRVVGERLLELLVRVPARGLTNVELPLRVANDQLARLPGAEGRVLLLSDCVHNAGPDPRPAAAALPRLDVLLDTTGEKDVDLGRDLARHGRGRLELVQSHRDIAPALSRILAP
jgi:Mg-chelatase subunit ChlD